MQREGLGTCDSSELYFEVKHIYTEKCTMGSSAGPARRRRRGAIDCSRQPVDGRFRQQDRTPFFLLTLAFGLRLLRKNGSCRARRPTAGPPASLGHKH